MIKVLKGICIFIFLTFLSGAVVTACMFEADTIKDFKVAVYLTSLFGLIATAAFLGNKILKDHEKNTRKSGNSNRAHRKINKLNYNKFGGIVK